MEISHGKSPEFQRFYVVCIVFLNKMLNVRGIEMTWHSCDVSVMLLPGTNILNNAESWN